MRPAVSTIACDCLRPSKIGIWSTTRTGDSHARPVVREPLTKSHQLIYYVGNYFFLHVTYALAMKLTVLSDGINADSDANADINAGIDADDGADAIVSAGADAGADVVIVLNIQSGQLWNFRQTTSSIDNLMRQHLINNFIIL